MVLSKVGTIILLVTIWFTLYLTNWLNNALKANNVIDNVITEGCFSEEICLSYEKIRKLPTLTNASMAPTRDMETLHRSPRNALHTITGPRTIIALSYGNQA